MPFLKILNNTLISHQGKEIKMKNYWFTVIRYFFAGEDSRPGIQDHWRNGFLAAHSPAQRKLLECTKVMVLLGTTFFLMAQIFPA